MIITSVFINGSEFPDAKNIQVNRSMGDFNTASDFSMNLDNVAGRHKDSFQINDEVVIYAKMI